MAPHQRDSARDLVGLSFVQRPDDVGQLLDALQALKGDQVGVVLKIESLRGFESLPELMLAAMAGVPSRAEISDASMGVRAECVMLNKGPHIAETIRTLDDILRRMGGHQTKKTPLLRALRAWGGQG